MAKMIIMYQHPTDKERFNDHYFGTHTALASKVPHVKHFSIHQVSKTNKEGLDLYLISEIEFESAEECEAVMNSAEWKEMERDASNLAHFLADPPLVIMTQ
ncbi:EthD family reductase [Priestia abyssalis]|uniref:EthD family reductase n=1 Tax=Priestia abyssalis TaxID=1221450 RepID=UPI001475ED60|nr:EthD family reductase [Priestia abyssalis]